MPKMPKIFECIHCDFKCFKSSNYTNHLLTLKHQILTTSDKKMPKIIIHECLCGKVYKHSSSLCNHKKTCGILKPDNINEVVTKEMVMQLIKQNKELQEMLNEQSNKMFEIAKEGKCITNNNTTNNFNLNVFLNEHCKDAVNIMDFVDSLQPQLKDLEDTARLGYVEGMSRIFITGLQNIDVHRRPIHCSDLKRDVLYIKDQNTWEKEDDDRSKISKAIKILGNKNIKQIYQWQKENPNYNDPSSKQNDRYMKMICNVMSGSTIEEQQSNLHKVIKNVTKEVVINKT